MKNIRILSPAEADLAVILDYYARHSPQAAESFLKEMRTMLGAIQAHPQAGSRIAGTMRRRLLHRFPYFVIYKELDNTIDIFGIIDMRREPGYWRARVDK